MAKKKVTKKLTVATNYTSIKRVSLVREGTILGRPALTSSSLARDFAAKYWRECPAHDQEIVAVICLDTKLRPLCVVRLTIGTLDASMVHPREVFKPAILEGSSAIILTHNHPSGDVTPSREDLKVTDTIREAGKLLGINLMDHIIYGDDDGSTCSINENHPIL